MMGLLAALPFVLQLAAAAPTPAITVRDANRSVTVAVAQVAGVPMLRIRALAPVLPVDVKREGMEAFRLVVAGAELRGTAGIPFVVVRDSMRQLAAAPRFEKGELLVPLQFVAELLPVAARTGVIWDAAKNELRVFTGSAMQAGAVRTSDRRIPRGTPRDEEPRPREPVRPVSRREGAAQRVVVVDAGHGGPDNGMTGPIGGSYKVYEKNITLQVARALGARLQDAGVKVVYTRTRDTLIALSDRGRIANDANGDLFISIHVNAANPNWKSPGAARGYETYFLSEAKTEDAQRVERMENESVRFETSDTDTRKGDALSFIVADMLQNEHLRESSELAEIIHRRLGAIHPGPNRGVKQAGFRVLVTAFMPSVLVEIGFGTNPEEAAFISSPAGQAEIADAVAAAALEYLERYERRVSGGGGE